MQDAVMVLAVLVMGGWLAGVINPAVVRCPGKSRWKIFWIGLLVTFVLLGIGGSIEASTEPSALGAVGGLGAMVISWAWPIWAIVALLRSRRAGAGIVSPADVSEPAQIAPRVVEPAAPPTGKRPEPLSKPQRKALGLPAIKAPKAPAAPPVEQTRAIRTGWRLCGVEFMYQDSKGNTTFRTVTVHSVGATSFKGECHHRMAERTFRFDRVIGDITDTETGEMLKPKKWAAQYG